MVSTRERIQQVLRGRTVLSFGSEWDLEQLPRVARLHRLPQIRVHGECLLHQATRSYQQEYGLRLVELCARRGASASISQRDQFQTGTRQAGRPP